MTDNENLIVVDTVSPTLSVVYTNPVQTINDVDYYNGAMKVDIEISEANFYPEDVKVTVTKDEVDYLTTVDWKDSGDLHTTTITLSDDGDYVVHIEYTDRSMNGMTFDGKELKTYISKQITIDTADPTIQVSYSPNNVINTIDGIKYYDANQTATITIIEHNFRAEDVIATITATDSTGAEILTPELGNVMDNLKNGSNWTRSGDIHTATVNYSNDANYTFKIDYSDLALRKSAEYKEDLFTVDKTPPASLNASYSTSLLNNVLGALSLGFYNSPVNVTLTATDATSGVHDFDYSAVLAQGVSGVNREILKQAISEASISYGNGKSNATATFSIPSSVLNTTNQFDGLLNFTVSDRSKNESQYSGDRRLVVDNISPTADITYNTPVKTNGNIAYYSGEINGTIRISEANFYSEDVNITATKDGAAYPVSVSWNNNSVDEHTGSFTLSTDGDYVIRIEYTDRSENKMVSYQSEQMTVDTTKPIIKISGIKNNSANNGETVKFTISASDVNFDSASFKPVISVVTMNNNGTFETKTINGNMTTVSAGKEYSYVIDNLEADGIYSVTCSVTDLAGNVFDNFVVTDSGNAELNQMSFSVNRKGSTFALDENTTTLIQNYYVKDTENDIVLFETNVDPLKTYEISLKSGNKEIKLVEDTDFTVIKSGAEGEWAKYTYKINKSLFQEEGEYKIVLTSQDQAGNDAYSDVKNAEINFVVDKTAPNLSISGIKSNGIYRTEKQPVSVIPKDDGGKLANVSISVLDNDGKQIENFNWEDEELENALADNSDVLSFDMLSGYNQSVQVVSADVAGNSTEEMYYFDNVTVSANWFITFYANKMMFWSIVIGALVVIGGVVFLIMRKKNQNN
jgi:hypothetical protein